jgi:hypothetical protein
MAGNVGALAMTPPDATPRPATPPRVVRVPSRSHPGEFHDVDLKENRCDCVAWAFHKRCSHLAAAQRLAAEAEEGTE